MVGILKGIGIFINKTIKTKNMRNFTAEQYKEMNAKGFEGDRFIEAEVKRLAELYNIKTIFETGSQLGNTTKKLAQYGAVVSCELNEEVYNKALVNIGKHALLFNCPSPKLLSTNVHNIDNKTLLYLDAHGNNGTPLLEELEIIAQSGSHPVIIIHDFKVPGKDFGFDTYKINGVQQDYTIEWILPALKKIYGPELCYHYNEEAEGAYRGVIYIYPKTVPVKKKSQEDFPEDALEALNIDVNPIHGHTVVVTESISEHKEELKENGFKDLTSETPIPAKRTRKPMSQETKDKIRAKMTKK